MRIVIFNVKYSPNLGDGLLGECLEMELRRCAPDVTVTTVDLAGRTSYGQSGRNRRIQLRVIEWLPKIARELIIGLALRRVVRRQLLPLAVAALRDADAVIVGGGNLIADADLNFPMKIHSAVTVVARARKPLAVFGVGVSDNWSRRGARLFIEAFSQRPLAYVAVRDARSQAIWSKRLERVGVLPADRCRDPGMLASRNFPTPVRDGKRVGLCLTDRVALRYHGAREVGADLDDWLLSLAADLTRDGLRIVLFTNGSPEDQAYLQAMAPRFLAKCGAACSVEPPFADPAALARFIASCSLVIAHRMHACIAAYSYGVPHLGLAWDPKLESFFDSVGRGEYLVHPAKMDAKSAGVLARRSVATGIGEETRLVTIEEASRDIHRLFERLQQVVRDA